MSASTANGPAGFRVIYPGSVLQAARRLGEELVDAEDRNRFAAALRVIHARLRGAPLAFGEHRFTLPGSGQTVRIAGRPPLIVRFAVNVTQRYVYVYAFHMPAR